MRYTTPDGRKLLSDMKIDIAAPTNREARRWRSVSPGGNRSQAPLYTPAPAAVRLPARRPMPKLPHCPSRFLDPPLIVAGGNEPGEGESAAKPPAAPADDDDDDDPPPRARKPPAARTARPVWSPYR